MVTVSAGACREETSEEFGVLHEMYHIPFKKFLEFASRALLHRFKLETGEIVLRRNYSSLEPEVTIRWDYLSLLRGT